jgi:flavin-dependent dehydrogenase
MIRTDVIIVGGGPAGSACAWRLRQNHVNCLIIDQHGFPRAKPCAGWITPRVVEDLGLEPGEYPHSFTTYRALTVCIRGFKLRLPNHQHAIRRIEFDHWLLTRSGAPCHEHTVRSIVRQGSGYEIDGAFASQYLVGAGGTYCPVYRTLFKADNPRARGALVVTLEEEFASSRASDDCWLWSWRNLPGYAWYVPKEGGYLNVGLGAWAQDLTSGGGSLRAHWERLTEELHQEGLVRHRTYRPRGYGYYLRERLRTVRNGNAFITGDAAGLATRDLGEGIGPAIRSGVLAADAIANGSAYTLDSIPRYSLGRTLGLGLRAVFGSGKRRGP